MEGGRERERRRKVEEMGKTEGGKTGRKERKERWRETCKISGEKNE